MRYVLADLEEAGAEMGRRAAEITGWLDAAAGVPAVGAGEEAEAAATALVDLACYQALSAAEQRLRAAAGAMQASLSDLRDVEGDIARRMLKGEP